MSILLKHPGVSAFIDGSLAKGNLGDDALLDAFHAEHDAEFARCFAAGTPDFLSGRGIAGIPFPPIFSGWRSFRSVLPKRRLKGVLNNRCGDRVVYVCVGGLLGEAVHVDFRFQIFRLIESLNWKFAYYFGDVEPTCKLDRAMSGIIKIWNRADAWVGVRSEEAARQLESFGLHSDRLHVGVDPVLYARRERFLNGPADRQRSGEAALIPCFWVHHQPRTLHWWTEATKACRKRGWEPRWCIFDRSSDVLAARSVCLAAGYSESDFERQVRYGDAALATVQSAEVCLTDRYHGAIFPITAGVPTIARGWNGKIRRLYHLLALDRWCDPVDPRSDLPLPDFDTMIAALVEGQWQPNVSMARDHFQRHSAAIASFRQWASSVGPCVP